MFNKLLILTIVAIFSFANVNANEFERFELKTPRTIPSTKFIDKNGVELNLNQMQGKVILVNFWATWCKPCKEEMPDFVKLQKDFSKKYFLVAPISIDIAGISAVDNFYKQNNLTDLPIFVDKSNKLYVDFKVQALPSSFLIDKQGMIIAQYIGTHDWTSDEFKNYIRTKL